jgi:hypothetical protein
MKSATIVHPGLSARLDGHYPQRVTLQVPSEDRSASGQVQETFEPFAGHADLPCALQPRHTTQDRTSGDVVRYMRSTHRIEINGYYPAITDRMLARIDGVNWKIEGVEHDSLETLTELFVWVRS